MTSEQLTERQRQLQYKVPLVATFAGFSGVGKDTAARALLRDKNRSWVFIGIADAIKDALLAIDPIVSIEGDIVGSYGKGLLDWVAEEGWDKTHRCKEVRAMMEAMGAWGRNIDPYFWAALAVKRVEEALQAGHSVAITDVRRQAELDILWKSRENFFALDFRIHRPGVEAVSEDEAEALSTLDEPSWEILNDGDEAALHAKVLAALADFVEVAP